jgi:hypothetical protein
VRASGQFRFLVRTFATRLIDGETSRASVAQVQFLIWSIALLTLPSLRVPMAAWRVYMKAARQTPGLVDLATYPHKLFFLGYTVLGVGLLALVIWDGMFPDRRDAWTFGTLPVRTRILVASRLAAMILVALVVVLSFNLPTVIVYSLAAGPYYGPLGIPAHAIGHVVATLALALTTFSSVIFCQALVLNLLPARWSPRAKVLLQVAFVVIVLQSVFTFPGSSGAARDLVNGGPSAWFAVPLWFLGLYEWLSGSTRSVWAPMAGRALASCAAMTAGALLAYALTYRRLCRRALEASELAGTRRLPRAVASSPRNAVSSFALLTLLRSRHHRLLLAIYFGVGLSLVLPEIIKAAATVSMTPLPTVRSLAMPLILIFFAVCGVRVLFAIPQDIGANWLFQLTEGRDRDSYLSGAVETAWAVAVLPVILVTTPLLWHAYGARAALTQAGVCAVLGGALAEAVLAPMRKIPFTCTYLPGSGNVRKWWPAYLFAFTTFSFTFAGLARIAIERTSVAVLFFSAALGAWIALRYCRYRLASRLTGFTYDEEPEDTVVTIDLSPAAMVRRAPGGAPGTS